MRRDYALYHPEWSFETVYTKRLKNGNMVWIIKLRTNNGRNKTN
jgi:hypothetical protein